MAGTLGRPTEQAAGSVAGFLVADFFGALGLGIGNTPSLRDGIRQVLPDTIILGAWLLGFLQVNYLVTSSVTEP